MVHVRVPQTDEFEYTSSTGLKTLKSFFLIWINPKKVSGLILFDLLS